MANISWKTNALDLFSLSTPLNNPSLFLCLTLPFLHYLSSALTLLPFSQLPFSYPQVPVCTSSNNSLYRQVTLGYWLLEYHIAYRTTHPASHMAKPSPVRNSFCPVITSEVWKWTIHYRLQLVVHDFTRINSTVTCWTPCLCLRQMWTSQTWLIDEIDG